MRHAVSPEHTVAFPETQFGFRSKGERSANDFGEPDHHRASDRTIPASRGAIPQLSLLPNREQRCKQRVGSPRGSRRGRPGVLWSTLRASPALTKVGALCLPKAHSVAFAVIVEVPRLR